MKPLSASLPFAFVASTLMLGACSDGMPAREDPQAVVWLDQNWNEEQRQWFHHADQGTETFLIPLEWLVALEQPGLHLFGAKPLFMSDAYMAGLGFIPDAVSAENPHGLPVGFAAGAPQSSRPNWTPVGLTCAACHTGHMSYRGTSIRYDGGPAMIAPDKLMNSLLRSMLETAYNGRQFARFAERVLGEGYADSAEATLKRDFSTNLMRLIDFTFQSIDSQKQAAILTDIADDGSSNELKRLAESIRDTLQQAEGFGRTDALNRIGNQVFALDINRPANFVAPNAPVSFPFIWSSSWFIWVQYDASIMQPMVRNAGEALGVGALLTLDSKSPNNFATSARLDTLHQIETQLAGATPAFAGKAFSGLKAPAWPEAVLGEIDREQAAAGATLYQQHCQRCHLPDPNTEAFWTEAHWSAFNSNGQRLLDLPLVPLEEIGTDPAQSNVLANRTVDVSDLGLSTRVLSGRSCESLEVVDGTQVSFAFALGAVVQEVVERWYDQGNATRSQRDQRNGYLPNCLQAPEAYKARPLNGIWATAPYLHNGSVPDLHALLSPEDERPSTFHVGNLEFDPERVGYDSGAAAGLFEFDTRKAGNSNKGHNFSDTSGRGVIGPGLSEDQRLALVEYLKTL